MTKTRISRALWLALTVTACAGISACSNEADTESSGEVLAVDRVDDAAALARKNAPKAEDLEFDSTAPMPAADSDTPEAEVAAADMSAEDAVVAEADAAPAEDLAVNVGEELYNNQCMACHATGLLNAPKYGDAAAWAPRIEKGLDTLTMHSAEGFNQMPAQATNGVTKEQIHSAVEYMVAAAS